MPLDQGMTGKNQLWHGYNAVMVVKWLFLLLLLLLIVVVVGHDDDDDDDNDSDDDDAHIAGVVFTKNKSHVC